mgnify:CR=1 FL=1|jgi:hypothetical protein
MLSRVLIIYILLTFSTDALHLNTFAVFELKEELQMLYINMWELLTQLEYVTPDQRPVVYEDIQHTQSEIQRVIALIVEHDHHEHP